MSPQAEAIMILGMALATFATRYPVLAILSKHQLPETFKQALEYVPPVVLTAIIVPEILAPEEDVWLGLSNNALIASVVAVLVSWRTNNLLATIVVGMGVYWLLG